MQPRRYEVKDLKTGKVTVFIGGEDARKKRDALENELVAFESMSELICPTCKQVLQEGIGCQNLTA